MSQIRWCLPALAAVIALLAAVLPTPPATAQEPSLERVAGPDRISTSVAIADRTHVGSAPVAVVARADAYPDALAGAPLASHLGGPLLLSGRDEVPADVLATIDRLAVREVVLLGGTAALGEAVQDQLEGRGVHVERLAGRDRFETAAAVADRVAGHEPISTAYLALGAGPTPTTGWADAVAVSALAASERRPVLLTGGDRLSDAARQRIVDLGLQRVVVVGGTASISDAVAQQVQDLGVDVERVAGASRFETSAAIATRHLESGSGASEVWLASGLDFPDALAAGAGAARAGGVLLLTDGRAVGADEPTGGFLAGARQRLSGGVVVGGTSAISDRVVAQAEAILRGDEGADPPAEGDLPPTEPGPGDVLLPVGADLQAGVDAHPPGTTFFIASGTHREQSIVARDGDRFVGMPGAVLSGARLLPPSSWQRDAGTGRWYVDGQTAEGFVQGADALANPRLAHPEELFVDGTRRLEHVGSLGELGPGRWYFDYAADRVWMHDDPASFDVVELSVTPFAIGGLRARDVVIENLVVEHYATPTQKGALGGAIPYDHPWDWTIRYVTVRHNHGAGITVGPGMVVEHAEVHHNGQIGIAGTGHDVEDGHDYAAPIVVRDSAIHHNNVHEYWWEYEAGGTKFKYVRGMVFENNWVYDNHGPGAWWDLEGRDVVVRGNLIERNWSNGIHYEISYGRAEILYNEVRDNGTGGPSESHNRACVMIANSSDVLIRGNVCYGQAVGIRLNHTDRGSGSLGRFETRDVVVEDNQVSFTDWSGMQVSNGEDDVYTSRGNVFRGNTYRIADLQTRWFELSNERRTAAQWQAMGMDPGGEFIVGLGPGPFPAGATPYQPAHHGALPPS